jgi:hypothetical protein
LGAWPKIRDAVFQRKVTDWNDYSEADQQNHWSERERATSVANADALGRPRRSVLSFGKGAVSAL